MLTSYLTQKWEPIGDYPDTRESLELFSGVASR